MSVSNTSNQSTVVVAPARLGLILTAILAMPVAMFFCFAAFSPASLAVPLSAGSPVTIWYAYGLGLIVFSLILGFIYVVVANRASDRAAKSLTIAALAGGLLLATPSAFAATPGGGEPKLTAIMLFMILVGITLVITWWAARRTRSVTDFYAAGGRMRALPNGLAIAGDLISAGAFLGLTGLVYGVGFDGLVYAAGYSVGYPVITMLFADRMRALGKFTFADILCSRLSPTPMRVFAAISTLCIVIFYLVAQMVGAGQLIELLFGVDYMYAEIGVGILMVCYVVFGGMMATTWVQIIKAVLMLISGISIALLSLRSFGWDYGALIAKAVAVHPKHNAMLAPVSFAAAPLSALSLGLAMFFGSAGLPHMIMRFFTVPNPRTARVSMMWASLFIGTFFALISVIGPSAVALVMSDPQYQSASGTLLGGGNMAAVHLAHALGGDLMLGFVSAVAFATILAVVAGLALAGASAVSHDLYANIICGGTANEQTEVRVSKWATVVLGVIAVALGIGFRNQNIAYLVALAISVAASSNFPLLLLAIYWRGLTTRGAVLGGCAGLIGSVGLTILGPAVWVKVLGYAAPVVALDPPTLITMPLAFIVAIGVSLLDRSAQGARNQSDFDLQREPTTMPVTT